MSDGEYVYRGLKLLAEAILWAAIIMWCATCFQLPEPARLDVTVTHADTVR